MNRNLNTNKALYFGLFFMVATFFSCSIPTNFYIQNLTNKTQKIKIYHGLKSGSNLDDVLLNSFTLYYRNEIVNPKKFKEIQNDLTLNFTQPTDSTLVVYLKPKSTTQIVKTNNYRWVNWFIKSVTIADKNINVSQLRAASKKMKHDYVYIIEEP
ncbi:hypothetical protein [Polaribacter sp. MED152]|uniref:hypothetical protein n=1 Tax=Polaribacter sp. MED152 TaxID=313598 RepID=UPI000068C5F0|nr:hypothetical protein [Polaribacter sp. MED152]EAQ42498.1 hypothetical protein MED152_07250 [Polaribacter sp. MED152]